MTNENKQIPKNSETEKIILARNNLTSDHKSKNKYLMYHKVTFNVLFSFYNSSFLLRSCLPISPDEGSS